MERHELERWLCGPDTLPPSPIELADALGLPGAALADTTLLRVAGRVQAQRLLLSVLRDAFADDLDVGRWLAEAREELGGRSASVALLGGRFDDVVRLAVETWNANVGLAGPADISIGMLGANSLDADVRGLDAGSRRLLQPQ
jgi:hypothetical protein